MHSTRLFREHLVRIRKFTTSGFSISKSVCGLETTTRRGNMKYTDGLVVENARIRNNLADGINFAQGTKNSTVKNSNIRGNGDDGLAIWSSISNGTNAAAEENNKFLNNTIESGWRAAGIRIFGGRGMKFQETSSRMSLLEQVSV